MKRAPFLGAAAAVTFAGCGGHHVMRALPGVAPSSQQQNPRYSGRLVPEAADQIPDSVLASPIIGEARRFDGSTAPAGWMPATGQTLRAEDHPQLFSMLKKIGGGDGIHTFTLPHPKFGLIIAIAGQFPTSPAVLAQSGRHLSHKDSLGPSAQPVLGRAISARAAAAEEKRTIALRDAQRASAAAPRARVGGVGRLSAELAAHIERSRDEARTNALARLTPVNAARGLTLVDAMVAGRVSLYEAQLRMAAALTQEEAHELLRVHDALQAAFRAGWPGMEHPQPLAEAAGFFIDVALTAEQRRTLASRPDH